MEKLKSSNRKYLRKVFTVKTIFYPLMLLLVRSGLASLAESVITTFIRLFGIRKSARYFFKYRQNARLFRSSFRGVGRDDSIILFPEMFGVNSNFTLLNMLFATWFRDRKRLIPLVYICDSAFGICTRDGMLKSRKQYPWFCHECWKGYTHIEKMTGIGTVYMSSMIDGSSALLAEAYGRIYALTDMDGCRDFTFLDMPLGIYARKSVLRYFLTGRLSDTPETLAVYRSFLQAGAAYAEGFTTLLDSYPGIRYMVVNNGSLLFEAIACELARRRSIDYMTYETYLGNNSLIYKKSGPVMELGWHDEYSKFTSDLEITPEIRSSVAGFFENLKKGVEMYAVLNTEHQASRLTGAGRYACLFTNLNYDTAVIDRNHTFTDMETWIMSVIGWWKSTRPGIRLVIRVHPGELKLVTASREFLGERIAGAIGGDDDIILFDAGDRVSSYELIRDMEFGLIYSSTIGLEIVWNDKPCLVAGMPWFRDRTFVLYPAEETGYFKRLSDLAAGTQDFRPDREELIRTVWFVYYNRMKRLNGIRLYTPREEPNTTLGTAEEMINENISFFNEFSDELLSTGKGKRKV